MKHFKTHLYGYVSAVSQIFFSLSLSQGVMQGYASNNPSSSPYISNAWIIGVANSSASIFAGFALFSTLGYLSQETGVPIAELAEPGFSLAFITYPVRARRARLRFVYGRIRAQARD